MLDLDRPIPLGHTAAPVVDVVDEAERHVRREDEQRERVPAAPRDDHPLAALRRLRFEPDGGQVVSGRRLTALGHFLLAYFLVTVVVVALIAGFLLLAGGWRTTT